MKKRLLSRLARAGYFKNANGALYAAAKRALRKPLHWNDASAINEIDPDAFGVRNRAVNTPLKVSPPQAKKRDRKKISMA